MPSCTPTSATWCARASPLRVWIVSPTTCMATLHTLRAVLKDARLRAEAHAIRRELGLLHKDVERLADPGRQPRPALRPGAGGHRRDPHLGRPRPAPAPAGWRRSTSPRAGAAEHAEPPTPGPPARARLIAPLWRRARLSRGAVAPGSRCTAT